MQTATVSRVARQPVDVLELWQAHRIETAEAANVWACAVARAQWTQDFEPFKQQLGAGIAIYGGRYTHLSHALAFGDRTGRTVIESTTRFFYEHGERPMVRLASLWPETVSAFEKAGYRSVSESLVIARPLTASAAMFGKTNNVRVMPGGEQQDTRWIRASTQGFCTREETDECEMQIGAALALIPHALLFAHRSADGEVSSTAALTLQDKVAMFFGDSTRKAWRGLGQQSAMITARLQVASARGCDLAVAEVEAQSGSARNYERAGFRPLYRRITLALDQ